MIRWLRAWFDRLLGRKPGPAPTVQQMAEAFHKAEAFRENVVRDYPSGAWYGTHAKQLPPR
jgi:hypothetical protein